MPRKDHLPRQTRQEHITRQPTFASEKPDGDGREETVEIIPITDIKGRGLRQSIRAEGKREV